MSNGSGEGHVGGLALCRFVFGGACGNPSNKLRAISTQAGHTDGDRRVHTHLRLSALASSAGKCQYLLHRPNEERNHTHCLWPPLTFVLSFALSEAYLTSESGDGERLASEAGLTSG